MYYDITNSVELEGLKKVREARPNISLPKDPTEQQLLEIGIAVVVDTIFDIPLGSKYAGSSVQLLDDVYTRVYTYTALTAEEIAEAYNISIPKSVSPRQARLALLQATLLDEVEALLINDRTMQIWWEYSLEIDRNSEHIIAMGTALGLTDLQLDDLFVLAASL